MNETAQTYEAKEGGGASDPPRGQESPAGGKLFIIAFRCGRLANRLALFANFAGWAEEEGHRVLNPTFHSYAGLLETTRRDIYCQYPAPRRKSWLDVVPGLGGLIRATRLFYRIVRPIALLNQRLPICGRRLVTLREIPGGEITDLEGRAVHDRIQHARVVFVYGWNFRAPTCVRRQAEKLRAFFRPVPEYEQTSAEAVKRLRAQAEIVVGVHIRHGDYADWQGGKYFFPVSRYAEWMGELAAQFPGRRVAFLICSNEPRQAWEFPGLAIGFGPGSPAGDLFALAKCDYIFGPVSSFSQWASFYGNVPLFRVGNARDHLDRGRFQVSFLSEIPA